MFSTSAPWPLASINISISKFPREACGALYALHFLYFLRSKSLLERAYAAYPTYTAYTARAAYTSKNQLFSFGLRTSF